MPLWPALEPLDDDADGWVNVVSKLKDKIQDTTLSFHKYLVGKGYPAPNVFARFGPSVVEPVFDPPLDLCPAVVIDAYDTDFVEDHGAGDERWFFSLAVVFKVEVRDQDVRVPIRATHELVRTIFHRWRALGPADALDVRGLGNYEVQGNLSPKFFQGAGILTAKTAFTLRFTLSETILG